MVAFRSGKSENVAWFRVQVFVRFRAAAFLAYYVGLETCREKLADDSNVLLVLIWMGGNNSNLWLRRSLCGFRAT